jgi:single-strand DNA-binding protein
MPHCYNKVILAGTLTRDPEIRYTRNGRGVSKVRLAVDDPQSPNSPSTYVDVVAWEELADRCNQFARGNNVLIEGRLSIRYYESNQNDSKGNPITRQATEIIADKIDLVQRGGYARRSFGGGGSARYAEDTAGHGDAAAEDLPFPEDDENPIIQAA